MEGVCLLGTADELMETPEMKEVSMKFAMFCLAALVGIIVFLSSRIVIPISWTLKMLLPGNSGYELYTGIYSFVLAGVTYEAFSKCISYILEGVVSLPKLFFKAIFILGIVYGVGILLGNWLHSNHPDFGAGTLGTMALMVFGAPFIMSFFLVTPLKDREMNTAFRSSGPRRDSRQNQSNRRD